MDYPRIRIVRIGKDPVIKFAAKELTRYLQKALPTLVVDELLKEEGGWEEGVLLLKVCPHLPEKLGVEDKTLDDGYRIQVKNGQGCILGTNERSVLLGVYRFLREMGFSFVRPGEEGERIPSVLPLEKEVEVLEKASYRHRGICIEGANTLENILDIVDYLPKVGMNEYFIQFLVPGTFFERWYFHDSNPLLKKEPLTREDVKAMTRVIEEAIKDRGLIYHKTGHGWTCEPFGVEGTSWDNTKEFNISEETKQIFAEVNGKRELWGNVPLNTNLCYSNPEVRDKMTSAITSYCLENPQVDVLHFWLADGHNNHCECENCRKKRPSDWYVTLLNELDEKMTAANLTTKVVALIYVDLLWKPEEVLLKHPDRFILMFAPITRKYGQNYEDSPAFEGELPPYVRNKLQMPANLSENMAHLKEWQEWIQKTSSKPLDSFIYDYHLIWPFFVDPGSEDAAEAIYKDMQYLHAMGLNGSVSCQCQRVFFPSGLAQWGMAQALWDPSKPYEEMAEEFYEESFGEDKDAVRSYMKTLSNCFHLYRELYDKKIVSSRDEIYVSEPEKVEEAIQKIRPLIETRILQGGGKAPKKEWELLKVHTEYVEKLLKVFVLRQQGEEKASNQASLEMFHFLDETELFTQKVLDGHHIKKMLGRHFALPMEGPKFF